jgi:hypothetical protein
MATERQIPANRSNARRLIRRRARRLGKLGERVHLGCSKKSKIAKRTHQIIENTEIRNEPRIDFETEHQIQSNRADARGLIRRRARRLGKLGERVHLGCSKKKEIAKRTHQTIENTENRNKSEIDLGGIQLAYSIGAKAGRYYSLPARLRSHHNANGTAAA